MNEITGHTIILFRECKYWEYHPVLKFPIRPRFQRDNLVLLIKRKDDLYFRILYKIYAWEFAFKSSGYDEEREKSIFSQTLQHLPKIFDGSNCHTRSILKFSPTEFLQILACKMGHEVVWLSCHKPPTHPTGYLGNHLLM